MPVNLEISESGDSCEDRIEQSKWSFFLVYSVFSFIIGSSFMYGYNIGVVNAPYDSVSQFVNESFHEQDGDYLTVSELDTQWSLVASLFLIGGTLSCAWFPQVLSNKFGLKTSLIYVSSIGVVGSIFNFISPYTGSYVPLYIGRALVGIQSGIAMAIVPTLIVEISPVNLRGACSIINTATLVFGLTASNGFGLPYLLGTDNLWQFLFIIPLVCFVLHAILMMKSAESLTWLVGAKKYELAMTTLKKLRSGVSETSLKAEFKRIKQMKEAGEEEKSWGLMEFFRNPQLRWPLMLCVNVAFCLPLTGIGIVVVYASDVLDKSGLEKDMAKVANFGISFLNIFGSVLSFLIIDRLGRRTLLFTSLVILALCLIFLTIVIHLEEYYASIAGLGIFLFGFAIGTGQIPWFISAEMFPNEGRATAMALTHFIIWLGYLIVTLIFPTMIRHMDAFSFLPFAAIAIFEFVFLGLFLPETKGLTSEEILKKFAPGQPRIQLRRRK